jgi:DNA-binding LacI/PurR family transcriptional regulator
MTPNDEQAMKSDTHRKARRSAKCEHIELTLRSQIVQGVYPPGGRLPLRTELETNFQAGPVTVQRALSRLTAEGFVRARGRGGTFVVEHPPHLSRYGMIFPKPLGSPDWNRFWTSLSAEAQRLSQLSEHLRIRSYHGIELREESPGYRNLVRDIEADQLAGVIIPAWPGFAEGTALLKRGLPRVTVASEYRWPNMSALVLDGHGLIDKALDHLAGRGRRKVAVIAMPLFADCNADYILSAVRARGMITHSYWLQGLIPSHPRCAESSAHLLAHRDQAERPDGLLIADDNLIEPVTVGLIAAGVRVPEEMEIVGHCNFPYPTPSHLPVTRMGYDTRQILVRCLECIDRQRRGDQMAAMVSIPALSEREVSALGDSVTTYLQSSSQTAPVGR